MTPPTPSGTPIAAEHIGYRVRCMRCGRTGEIDDVTPDGTIIVRHDAVSWCVLPASANQPLELWQARVTR